VPQDVFDGDVEQAVVGVEGDSSFIIFERDGQSRSFGEVGSQGVYPQESRGLVVVARGQ